MKKKIKNIISIAIGMVFLLQTGTVSSASGFFVNDEQGKELWVDLYIQDSNTFFIPCKFEDSASQGTYYKTVGGVVYRWLDNPDDTNYATVIAICPEEKTDSVTILDSLGEEVYVKYIDIETISNVEEVVIQKNGGNVFVSDFGGSEDLKRVKLQGDCSGVIFYEGCFNGCTGLESITYMDKEEQKYMVANGALYYMNSASDWKVLENVFEDTLKCYEVACDVQAVSQPFGYNETVEKLIIKGDLDWLTVGEMVGLKKIVFTENVKRCESVNINGATAIKKLNLSDICVERFSAKGALSLREVSLPANCRLLSGAFSECKNLKKITFADKKAIPKIKKGVFNHAGRGIKFYVKNKKVAKDLKKQLMKTTVKNAKIYVKGKLLYKNINGS